MPSCVLKCEECGSQRPFMIHEGELSELENTKPIQKQCPTCRTLTNWQFAFRERRRGRERRSGTDRRPPE